MIYESKIHKRFNRAKLSMSERLSPDKIISDTRMVYSKGGDLERALKKNMGDITNKNPDNINPIQKTLEKVYKRMEDLNSGRLRH